MQRKATVKNTKRLLLLGLMLLCIATAYFLISKPESQKIPKLYFYGDMDGMTTKTDVRSISVTFKNGNEKIKCYASIKPQGTSSMRYEKKNYTIKFYEDASHESEKGIDVGWGAQNEYCLKANWIDKTHSRNIVTAKLVAEIQGKYNILEQTPRNGLIDGFPIEVYINDQFHGLYTWNIPKAAWMFSMDEDNPNHIVLGGENYEPAALFYDVPNFSSWSVEVGPENDETLTKFAKLVDFIMNSSDEDFKKHFSEHLDLDAMLTYYIMVDFAYLTDNRGKNMLMATYDGDVWYPSLYDLDTSWGTHWSGTSLQDYKNGSFYFPSTSNLARRTEIAFSQELHNRYFELRKDVLTKEHIMNLFYEFDARIPADSKSKEIQRWGEDIPGYDLSQIEEFIDTIIVRLDKKYEALAK